MVTCLKKTVCCMWLNCMHIIGNLGKTFELVEALSGSHLHIQVKKKKKKGFKLAKMFRF
jgi:hypothetical protein